MQWLKGTGISVVKSVIQNIHGQLLATIKEIMVIKFALVLSFPMTKLFLASLQASVGCGGASGVTIGGKQGRGKERPRHVKVEDVLMELGNDEKETWLNSGCQEVACCVEQGGKPSPALRTVRKQPWSLTIHTGETQLQHLPLQGVSSLVDTCISPHQMELQGMLYVKKTWNLVTQQRQSTDLKKECNKRGRST